MGVGRPRRSLSNGVHLGQAIAARRVAAGMTQSGLATRAGISGNTLMKVEQGQTRDPGVLKVAALCRALSVSIDDLVRTAEQTHQSQEITMSHGIVSVGYQGRTIEALVEDLQRAGVRTVADVRLNAISRKPGFSKNHLREALAAAGIGYRHMRSLGNAKENRRPFWDGRPEVGRQVFREALQASDAESSLHELASLVRDEVVAVLCFETDLEMCHRKVVIEEVVGASPVPVVTLPD
jgi:transcriptional regulator with XRE-family HTH domain